VRKARRAPARSDRLDWRGIPRLLLAADAGALGGEAAKLELVQGGEHILLRDGLLAGLVARVVGL
jgi:hypothetical protein